MAEATNLSVDARTRANRLLQEMSLPEKIGQLVQVEGNYGHVSDELRDAIRSGRAGSVINEVDPGILMELQRLAREESPHGIPLLIGRDVIHGFKTVFPIPLAMAATWNEELIEESARCAAWEASQQGVNWTFSPMLDVSRDPRWGRIAESFGEDAWLTGLFGAAMVRGYQNGGEHQLISCLKHFVGYGACEAGKDYNTTNIPDIELHNTYLPPFEACVRAGAMSVMPSFSDLNGMPPSGNRWLLRDVLREEWNFAGFVISDWASISQLCVHGVAADNSDAARQASWAGVNMDMVSGAYAHHLQDLVESEQISIELVNELVCEILTVKFAAGLFDLGVRNYIAAPMTEGIADTAQRMAQESIVLLQNKENVLPLNQHMRVCLVGPLADEADEQLGTWVFDGDASASISIRQALAEKLGEGLSFHAGLSTSRDRSHEHFAAVCEAAGQCDVIVIALGEEAILSGEAHCRSEIELPGAQAELLARLAELGKPIIAVILAGRPLAITNVVENADAILYAWHPGTMAGPAISNLLFGEVDPVGRLPVTLPRSSGQVPIYYAHGHTGKPATPETVIAIDDIDAKAAQTSVGNTCFHLDVDPSPLFAFGHGLSYTDFSYTNLESHVTPEGNVEVAVKLTNCGARPGREVAQLYVRDLVASATRPVRLLKAFEAVTLPPGASKRLVFKITRQQLSFHNGREFLFEPGQFQFWVGADVNATLNCVVELN